MKTFTPSFAGLGVRRGLIVALTIVTALAIGFTESALAQTEDHSRHPGFVDGDFLRSLIDEDDTFTEVNVMGPLAGLAAKFVSENTELVAVRVIIFTPQGADVNRARTRLRERATALSKAGWQPMVRVQDPEQSVTVLTLGNKAALQGIFVAIENAADGELVFVNLAGRLDYNDLEMIIDKYGPMIDLEPAERNNP